MPDHFMRLKCGLPIMLIRNVNPQNGVCSSVRLTIVVLINIKLLVARKQISKELHHIPRIDLTAEESENAAFKWKMRQLPIKLAFALTIIKN